MAESVDPRHLLLIGAGPGVGASVVRRFGREGFRSTLISRGEALEQLAPELRSDGLEIEPVGADIEDLDGYRGTLARPARAELPRPGRPRRCRVQRCPPGSWRDPRHDGRTAPNRI